MIVRSAVLIQRTRVRDGRTDGRTEYCMRYSILCIAATRKNYEKIATIQNYSAIIYTVLLFLCI